jgi:hypothetical protein
MLVLVVQLLLLIFLLQFDFEKIFLACENFLLTVDLLQLFLNLVMNLFLFNQQHLLHIIDLLNRLIDFADGKIGELSVEIFPGRDYS